MSQRHGVLIVLNGASSAGKTRTAEALIALLGDDWRHTGLDDVLARVQPFGPEASNRLGRLKRAARVAWFGLTDGRLRLCAQLHQEVVALCKEGRNLIIETALVDERELYDAAECFAPLDGLFIGMKPPLAVSEEWEAARGDRPSGHARRHYDRIHAHGLYDLVLDPSQLSPSECARAILRRLDEGPPTAFRSLLQRARAEGPRLPLP